MKNTTRARWGRVAALVLLLVVLVLRPAEAGSVVGIGTPASCTEAALDTALTGGGLVTFNCGPGPVTILLTSSKSITADTTLDGASRITLSGGGTTRLFDVAAGTSLSLNNLTVSEGGWSVGGAINNNGRLTIANSTLLNNISPVSAGGAIYNTGTGVMTITNSIFSDNTSAGGVAGGIGNDGTATIVDSDFSSNAASVGGAIANAGIMTIRDTSFAHNQCTDSGGGIYNTGTLTIDGSTFYSNTSSSSGGGLYNYGSMTVTNSSLDTNYAGSRGGGLYNGYRAVLVHSTILSNTVADAGHGGGVFNDILGVLTISTSTLAGNSVASGYGGGVYNQGSLFILADTFSGNAAFAGLGGGVYSAMTSTVAVTNSTFSDNNGGFIGGGLIAEGTAEVASSTFYSNTSGGLVNGASSLVVVRNSIVANNTQFDCWGPVTSLGHNLDGANTCAFAAAGDLTNTNPLLGPLAQNGGPTRTRSPLPGSPAINAGTNVGCPATDQRGVPRPQFGTCDIGAVEFVMRVYLPVLFR